MKIKFRTFCPRTEYDRIHGNYNITATAALNKWLNEHPNVEIISWQTTAVGTTNELYITIQCREREE